MEPTPNLIGAVEELTGLTFDINWEKQSVRVHNQGNDLEGFTYTGYTELLKNVWRILAADVNKHLALLRLADAVEKEEPWTEWFEMAVEAGWDPQQAAELAKVPSATNVRVIP